jgi:hypothetical protein
MWPDMVQFDEVRDRLLLEGMPAERVFQIHSEIRHLRLGDRARVERAGGNLFLLAQGDGWYSVVPE